jgi:hypothetical protein
MILIRLYQAPAGKVMHEKRKFDNFVTLSLIKELGHEIEFNYFDKNGHFQANFYWFLNF